MNDPAHHHEVIIWADATRSSLIEQVLGRMSDLNVLAVGGPRKSSLTDLAGTLDADVEDDLRKMLIDHPAGYLLLATAENLTAKDLEQARKADTTILALEPVAATLDVLGDEDMVRSIVRIPAFDQCPAWLAAAEPEQALGTIQSIHLTSLCSPKSGSLYARLYDALDMLLTLMPAPETIDAALTGPLKQPPEDLRSLTGHITAHLRFATGASAVMHISDQAAAWSRRIVLLGTEGELELDDIGYRLVATGGQILDSLDPETTHADPADLIIQQWRRLLDRPPQPRTAPPHQIIAAAQSALLSCRTGELESLATLLRMRRGAAV